MTRFAFPPEYGKLTGARIEQLHQAREETATLIFEHVTLEFDGLPAAQIARALRVIVTEHQASIERFRVTMTWHDDQ